MAALSNATYGKPAEPDGYRAEIIRIPDGTDTDGAVAELYHDTDGHLAADIRIPAK